MPICTNCNTWWTWKDTWKATFRLDTRFPCPYCQAIQFQSKNSRKKLVGFNFATLVPILLFLFDIPWYWIISLWASLFVCYIVTYPFLVELTSEEEDYFSEVLKEDDK